ncbi:hypothetical protein ACFY05_29325 [Microtetraspora fusca]|uniref:Uncharacterized protein n=1 Tax=Microtetraspora fusca TaxID=1997 RepID=A0ABW6VC97_MICFU
MSGSDRQTTTQPCRPVTGDPEVEHLVMMPGVGVRRSTPYEQATASIKEEDLCHDGSEPAATGIELQRLTAA